MVSLARWRELARELKADAHALYLASRHPRTPWHAKLIAMLVAAYAFSPIDLIPDPIPILGYLDDLVLLPLGIWLALRLIPADVWAECSAKARASDDQRGLRSWYAAAVIGAVWIAAVALSLRLLVPWAKALIGCG